MIYLDSQNPVWTWTLDWIRRLEAWASGVGDGIAILVLVVDFPITNAVVR